MPETNERFQAFIPGTANSLQGDALYTRDLSPNFPEQLLGFRDCFKSETTKEPTAKDLAKMLIVDHSSLPATFSDVCRALQLYSTISITVTAQRSFS